MRPMNTGKYLTALALSALPSALLAQTPDLPTRLTAVEGAVKSAQSAGDNAWMLVSAALVLMMTGPGLALFYGGLVRRKNVLGTMMHSFILMAVVTVLWAVVGYSLAFGGSGPFIGNLDFAFLKNVGSAPNPDYAGTIPQQTFMVYQLMFAIITPALISGAFAERMKFSAMLLFTVLWSLVVYFPMAHMVWGKGGLLNAFSGGKVPCFDFAGGTVVHITSGVSALVCALVLGKRVGYPNTPMKPHNLVISFIGACMLWVGWFGFNAGSALAASDLATSAFVASAVNNNLKDAAGRVLPLGLMDGNAKQIGNQAIGCLISWVLAIVGTLIILKICEAITGLRVSKEEETDGLDLSQHGEEGYI